MKPLNTFSTNTNKTDYQKIHLDEQHYIKIYRQVALFQLTKDEFNQLWKEHPDEFHEILIHGKRVKTPRWQQAYGKNYDYTGARNNALPLSRIDHKYLEWCQNKIDKRLNGLLLNWYDGTSKHYIGKHRDSTKGLKTDSPIVTISHGEERLFRLRPYRGQGYQDFVVKHGDVLVIPWHTNQNYTHEVPHFKKYTKRRISVTLRAYT